MTFMYITSTQMQPKFIYVVLVKAYCKKHDQQLSSVFMTCKHQIDE